MPSNIVGGDESNIRYFGLYVVGVFLGSLIRIVAYAFPSRIVHKLEELLVGDLK
jgi:hypothetical protein